MTSLFNRLSSTITRYVQPVTEQTLQEKINSVWERITVSAFSGYGSESIAAVDALNDVCKDAVSKGIGEQIKSIFGELKIPFQIVSYAVADSRAVPMAQRFFINCTTKPLQNTVYTPEFLHAMDKLIENVECTELLEHLRQVFIRAPRDTAQFIENDPSSHTIQALARYLSGNIALIGDLLFIVIGSGSESLIDFALDKTELVQRTIGYCKQLIDTKSVDVENQSFMNFFNLALSRSSGRFRRDLLAAFEENIISPYVLTCSDPFHNSMYIISTFSSDDVHGVMNYIKNILPDQILSENEVNQFKSLRCTQLILERSKLVFPSVSESESTHADYLSLLPPEWFSFSDVASQLASARSQIMLHRSRSEVISYECDVSPFLNPLFSRFDTFFDNSMRVNLALTEVLTTLAATWNSGTQIFYSLHSQPNFFKSMKNVVSVALSRSGNKANVVSRLQESYKSPSDDFYSFLAVLIEFIGEMHALGQSKSILSKREELREE